MTKRKSWTIFILLTLTLITLLIAPITVWYNLKHYSVHYAQHIPHKEEEHPELAFIIDNLFFINIPIDKYKLRNLGHEIYPRSGVTLRRNSWDNYGYMLNIIDDKIYIWDESTKFKYVAYYDNLESEVSNRNEEIEANKELHNIIDPIIAIQPEPKLNLQWLFNWVHRDRFNQE